jgi:hypothetical protein
MLVEAGRLFGIQYAGKGGNMTKIIKISSGLSVLAILISGCGQAAPSSGMNESTARIYTVIAYMTEQGGQKNNPSLTFPPATATQTSGENPIISLTATPTHQASNNPALPSVTPTSTKSPICYRAGWIKDVTIPDYTKMAPGQTFVKTWRLSNNGTCNWPSNTELIFFAGNPMNGPASQAIGKAVNVNEQIDISVSLKAPTDPNTYTGYWWLRAPDGTKFGIGETGDQTFYVAIVVTTGTTTATQTKTLGTPPPTKTETPTPTSTPTITPTPTPTPTATCPGPYPPPC